jgi:photosystem II stability/assembly factor-like uncharacterized protein
MNRKLAFTVEILLSGGIVFSLLWVAFYVKPSATVEEIKPSPFGRRVNYLGAAAPAIDGSVLWAVGRKGRIIRSDDHGRNWEIQNSPVAVVHLQDIDTWDEQSAVVAGDLGTLLVTRDGGANWQQRKLPLREYGEQFTRVKAESDSDRAWVVGAMGSVFLSEDRGESWRMVHPEEDLSWNGVDVTSDGVVWVVGEFGRMSRSRDLGENWEEVNAGIEQSLMDINFADTRLGVAVGLGGTLVVTSDGGENWSPHDAGTGMHINDITWDGERFVAVGGGGILLTSGADGLNWNAGKLGSDNSLWYTAIVPVAAPPPGGKYLAAGANLGIWQDSDWQIFLHMREESAVGEVK